MNLLKSTGTFGFFTIISRLLGYLRDFFIAIFLGTGVLADVFLLLLEFQIHLEDYFLRELLTLPLSLVTLQKLLKEKTIRYIC